MFSRSALRNLLRRLVPSALAAGALWYAGLSGPWNRAATAVAEVLVRAAESPARTFLVREGNVVAPDRPDLPGADRRGLQPSAVTWNLVALLAFVAATPGILSRRGAVGAAVAGALLLVAQGTHLALKVGVLYMTAYGDWSAAIVTPFRREVVATTSYFFDIVLIYAIPFVLWAACVAFPLSAAEAAEPIRKGPKGKKKKKGA